MIRQVLPVLILVSLFSAFFLSAKAQQPPPEEKDTFFLAKKHGILGRLAQSISVSPPGTQPVKIANPYIPYAGMVIRYIELTPFGFDRNIYDTTIIKHSFGMDIANELHRNTKTNVIANDLLFKAGDRLFPNLLADNERLLREEVYLQDARILVKLVPGSTDSVDVIVITKDVFSIGATANISSTSKGIFQVKEENVGGSGSRAAVDYLYDKSRSPVSGYGAEFVRRNIRGSFIDWTTGFQTYAPAISNGQNEVTTIYTGFQKPLVTPYIPWTGALNVMFNQTVNNYLGDTQYSTLNKYNFYDFDGWFGYNFGSRRLLYKNLGTRLRKFIAVRALDQHFGEVPDSIPAIILYRYADIGGALGAFTVFQQDFYRTNFIYGFGRDEDVPQGFNASLIGGWTDKREQLLSRKRPYFAFSGELTHFSQKGSYSDYLFKIGANSYQQNLEDFDILLDFNHFTQLKKMSDQWYNRNFITASITKQINPVLDQPLILQSNYGLPYFGSSTLIGDLRTTLTGQAVFFNMRKFLGFRFAPFIFTDMSLLTPTNTSFDKSDLFGAVGGGVRTRNENLIFGTIELKGYYFPRTVPGMNEWRIDINTNLQFKFNSTFIQEPDFVSPN